MNILFLTQEYPPETGWGGIGSYTYTMAHALARAGHLVHVLTSAVGGGESSTAEDRGVHVHRVRRWSFNVPLVRRFWFNTLPWTKHQWEYMLTVYGVLGGLVRQYAIDCVESCEIWAEGLLYSFRREVPILVKLSGPLFLLRRVSDSPQSLDWKLVENVDRRWTKRADQLVSVSANLADIVAEEYKLHRETIRVIPNPVDLDRFQPSSNGQPKVPTVVYAGRLEPHKGVMTLADAIPHVVAAYPEARFLFVGTATDSHRNELLKRLEQAGTARHVEFTGHIPNAEIAKYYKASSACVFPSLYESFGIACLEAMACARPVVASSAGGMVDLVQNGVNGLVVPPQKPIELAEAIKTILADPQRGEAWGRNGRRRVETLYSSEVVARQNLEVYRETIERWQRTHPSR